jgi:SAM-dependent methyltransferase
MSRPAGTGPGPITADGCAVDVYRQVPTSGEPELIHANLPTGASVLDLGAGVGRIADPLAELGHHVVAVDDSADMLAHVRVARPVLGRIETLTLPTSFNGVVMASHLANVPDQAERRALFGAARRHLARGGTVFVQWYPPEWFDRLRPGTRPARSFGAVTSTLQVHSVVDGVLDATVSYRSGARLWTQRFQARKLVHLPAELAACGLMFDRFLTPDRSWFAARATRPN